jgi:serine/threonine protein kinase
MKYGGPSLTQHFKIPMENTYENRERINNFWINSIELFNGLILFLENGIVHHDLKPDNIVYDESINSVKIIDYGLMQYKDKMIRKSEESRYNNSKFHFNYPFETALYNKNTFLTIKKTGDISGERVKHYFRDEIKDSYHYAMSGLMAYIENEDLHPRIEYLIENGFYDFLDNAKYDDSTYTMMLNKSINTFDMYGLGMSLFYVLNKVYKLMKPDIVKKLDTLFTKMIHPDIRERIELKNALFLYKNIIQNMPLSKKTDPIIQQNPIKPKPETTYDFTSSELRMSSDNKGGKSRTRRRKKNVKYVNRRSKSSRRIKKKRTMRSH